MAQNVEFVKLPDGRIAAVVDIEQVNGETSGGNIRIAKTDGAGAQIAENLYFAVNVWKRAPKTRNTNFVEVKSL